MCLCTEPHLVDLLAVVSLFVACLLRLSKGVCGLLHRSQRQRVRLHRRHWLVEGIVHLRVGDAADVARRSNAAGQGGGLVQLRGLQKHERGVGRAHGEHRHQAWREMCARQGGAGPRVTDTEAVSHQVRVRLVRDANMITAGQISLIPKVYARLCACAHTAAAV